MLWSLTFNFLTAGFIKALFGGFFFDKHSPLIVNIIHAIFWTFLLLLPLLIGLFVSKIIAAIVYTSIIFILFSIIKFFSYWLHCTFDKERKLKEKKETQDEEGKKETNDEEEKKDVTEIKNADTTEPETNNPPPEIVKEEEPTSQPIPKKQSKLQETNSNTGTGNLERDDVSTNMDSMEIKDVTFARSEESTDDGFLKEDTISEGELSEGEITKTNEKRPPKASSESKTDRTSKEEDILEEKNEEKTEKPLVDDPRAYGIDENVEYYFDEDGNLQTLDFNQLRAQHSEPFNFFDTSYNRRPTDGSDSQEGKKIPEKPPPTEISICGYKIEIPFTRLFLLQLLDRNLKFREILISILLATSTAWLGIELVEHYEGFSYFMLWFIVAASQFSLLKSPQPDAPSPRADENKYNSLNRSFYFIWIACLIITLRNYRPTSENFTQLYGLNIDLHRILHLFLNFLIKILPYFPLIYVLGLLPQANTVIMYTIEQANILFFGGSGTPSLGATIFDFFRGLTIVGILFGICYTSKFQGILFSFFLGLLVGLSYLQSRLVSDPLLLLHIDTWFPIKSKKKTEEKETAISLYPYQRLKLDLIITVVIIILVTGLYYSRLFHELHLLGLDIFSIAASVIGFVARSLIPTLRKPYPFKIFQCPFLETPEYSSYEPPNKPSKKTWFETVYIFSCGLEKYLIYPVIFLIGMTLAENDFPAKFSLVASSLLISIIGFKLFRSTFSDPSRSYLILIFTLLFFNYDFRLYKETFLLNYFLASLLVPKIIELLLKVNFLLIYIAPWNLSWGSAVHAILQPLGIPHTSLCLFQLLLTTLFTSPIYPFIGSTIFLASYGRPVKFWERSYKTGRVDNTQTKLSEMLDSSSESDSHLNNLNSIFYEHLMSSLQSTLNKEIEGGRFGNVSAGDFFLLINDKLTAMLHIIEIGNGFCTFQLRGMEFKGTYCQERELEEISKVDYSSYHETYFPSDCFQIPKLLPFTELMSVRWNSWEVINIGLMLSTYSISLNPANSMFNVWNLRKVVIKYYIDACIYYLSISPSLESWMNEPSISQFLQSFQPNYADRDPIFSNKTDEDFDERADGISLSSFEQVYGKWIKYCLEQRIKSVKTTLVLDDSKLGAPFFNFCYVISILARRCLIENPNNVASTSYFLERYHSLFKGDLRITSTKDEWVLAALEIMNQVLGNAIRMSLRLHQDHFIGEEFDDHDYFKQVLDQYQNQLVVCHEGDPLWRSSILKNVPNLLSLRKHMDLSGENNEHSILALTLRYMKFRVIKLNRESVRGLWTGQQQELVFLGNQNPERGSIQQLRTVLRNLVNQSCDGPVGYPIFVSELTTSYSTFWTEIFKFRSNFLNWSINKS